MALTTVARIEVYLGLELSSTQTVEMELIIASTQQMMESYCNRSFDQADYYHQRLGTGDREIVINNTPITSIKWAGAGMDEMLSITYSGTKAASIEIEDQELRLSENLTTTTIDLADSSIDDIDDLVTAIDLLTGWSATAVTAYGSYPALILNPIVKCPVDSTTNFGVGISGSASQLKLFREREGLYVADSPVGNGYPYTVIYEGGYETIPASLAQLATEMCAAVWRIYVLHGGGVLQAEKIGDFSYRLNDIVGDDGSVSIINVFKTRIDQFARIEI